MSTPAWFFPIAIAELPVSTNTPAAIGADDNRGLPRVVQTFAMFGIPTVGVTDVLVVLTITDKGTEAGVVMAEPPDATEPVKTTIVGDNAEPENDCLPSPVASVFCPAAAAAATEALVAIVARLVIVEAVADGSNTRTPPAPTVRAEPSGKAVGLVTISVPDNRKRPADC